MLGSGSLLFGPLRGLYHFAHGSKPARTPTLRSAPLPPLAAPPHQGAGNMGGVNRLLNRLLGVRVDMQRRIFQYFTALLVRGEAREGGGFVNTSPN